MDSLALLRAAHDAGLAVHGDGEGRLIVRGPKRLAALAQQLLDHKQEVLPLWEEIEEQICIMEFDGKLSRTEAERLAWECLCEHAGLPMAPVSL